MKKVMICAITLLPLIILLTLFVSTTVIGFSTYVYVQQIQFVNEEYVLKKADENNVSERLKINVFPMQANNKEVEYWSDDTSIATVDEDGNITSVDFGEVIIYARSKENSTIKASCKVLVTDDKIHRLYAVDPPEKMLFGESIMISFTYVPKEAQNKDLAFESLNDFATVSPDGTVTANNEVGGMARIRIYAKDNPSAQTEVEIKVYGKVESLSFEDEAAVLDAVTEFDLPEVIIYPQKAAPDAKLYYYLGDKDKGTATIDQENGKLKFSKAGTVTLYVRDDYEHEISKKYTSTDGHYETIKFDETSTEITVNYEDYTAENGYLLGVTYSGTPEKATQKITLITDKPDVIAVENDKFVVKGGGTTDIHVEIEKYNGETVRATLKVTVNRKADSIDFLDENGNGGITQAVTLGTTFNIRTKILPEDSTDAVASYEISGNATVSNAGIVTFETATEPQTAVVKVTAKGGVTSELTVTYIPDTANPVQITNGGSYSFDMPKSTAEEQFVTFAPYYTLYSADEIEYYLNGEIIEGLSAKITAPGKYTIAARDKAGATLAESTVNVIRRAESVTAKLYAVWGETKEELTLDDNKFYTSAKTVSIESITVRPADATKETPDSIVSSDTTVATVSGNVLTFGKAGTVTLTIKVDDATFTATIESTCGLFDEKTDVNTADRAIDKGVTLNVSDFFTRISPAKADMSNAWFEWNSEKNGQSIDLNNCPGGVYNVRVFYTNKQGTPIPSVYFTITVHETATDIEPKNGTFVIADSNEVTLSSLFSIEPSTANYLIGATYSLESSCASISDGKLTFTSAGKAVVTVKLEKEGVTKTFAVVYYGETTKLNGGEYVEIGDEFTVNISETVCKNLNADSKITVSNNGCATLSNGFVITVNEVGEFQVKIVNSKTEEIYHTYDFEGVVKATGVSIDIADNEDESKAHLLSNGTYLTGLTDEAITISATLNEGATNKGITYTLNEGAKATIDQETGELKFSAAGTVTVTATEKFGKSASITIRSTYGKVERVTLKSGSKLTLDYDDYQLATGYDFTNYFTPYPAQASITNTTVKLKVTYLDNSNAAVTIVGLKVKLSARTNFTLTCEPESGASTENSASVNITVNRKATSVKVNGTDISKIPDSTITTDRSFIDVKTAFYPADANQLTNISFGITADGEYATLDEKTNRITFNQADKDVTVTFKYLYNDGDTKCTTKHITFSTSKLTETVLFSNAEIVVPCGELFTFGDVDFNSITDLKLPESVDIEKKGNNYIANNSGKYEFGGIYKGKTLIVTAPFASFGDVSIYDTNTKDSEKTSDKDDYLYSSASSEFKINFSGVGENDENSVGNAMNKNGTAPTVTYETSDTSIAEIDKGELRFKKSGEVTVTISVSGTLYGDVDYSVTYSFKVYSSFGHIDDFTLDNAGETIDIVIDDIVINDTASYKLTYGGYEPLNGTISEKLSFKSSNKEIATVDQDGLVEFFGTGTVEITVSAEKGDGATVSKTISFKVDKLVGLMTQTDTAESDSAQRSSVIVNGTYYQLNTAFWPTANGTKLPDESSTPKSLKRSSTNTSGERVLDISTIAPTLINLKYTVEGDKKGCTVNEKGEVTFDENAVGTFVIIIKETYSGVEIKFPITKVGPNVEIITVQSKDDLDNRDFQADVEYIIDAGFGDTLSTINISVSNKTNIVTTDIGSFTVGETVVSTFATFKVASGSEEIKIEITRPITSGSGEDKITHTTFVEETVKEIKFTNKPENISNTADVTFDLTAYGAKISDTAGYVNASGEFVKYKISYWSSDQTIAKIDQETGLLTFIAAGNVEVYFKVDKGEETICRSDPFTIESTFGYATNLELAENVKTLFEYTSGSYTFAKDTDFTVTPANARESKYDLTITSSNQNVATVDGLTLNFVGGGETKLYFEYTYLAPDKNTTTATLTLIVGVIKRADGISVTYAGRETQNILASDNFMLNASVLGDKLSPYTVSYESSDKNIATVDTNGNVTFRKSGVACKITVGVVSDYDNYTVLEKVITVRKAPYTIKQITDTTGALEFNYEEGKNYSLYYIGSALPSTFEVSNIVGNSADSGVLSVTKQGDVTILGGGTATLTITTDSVTKTVEIAVIRKAESVTAKLYAVWGKTDKEPLSGTLYTSAKTISIENIVIAPADATKTKPDSVVSSDTDVATVIDGVLTFKKAGTVTLTIEVDGKKFTAEITSTYGGFYDNTATKELTIDVSDGEKTLTAKDVFEGCESYKFDFEKVKFRIEAEYGDKAVVGENRQSVTFSAGGTYSIKMEYPAANGETKTETITVTVNEKAKGVKFEGGSFKLPDNAVVELSSIYRPSPVTANVGHTATSYEFVGDVSEELATIDKTKGTLEFKKAGKVIVKVTLGSGASGNIAVAYYGKTAKLNGDIRDKDVYTENSSYYVTVGSSFVVDISEDDRATLSATTEITVSNNGCATISNGFVITVDKVGEFQVTIGDNTYDFEGVVKATGVSIGIADNAKESKAHILSKDTYLTGLKDEAITIYATLNEGATNKGITYTLNEGAKATIDQSTGVLTFNEAGTVTVTATEKFGKSASITIRSTYGKVESITFNSGSALTLDYDKAGFGESGYDFTTYFKPYPAQASITNTTVKLKVTYLDNSNAAVTIVGLKVKLSARTNFTLTCEPESGASTENSASIDITVNRKATSISVNGTDISEITDTITAHRAFIDISCAIIPADANENTAVNIEMISGSDSEYATFNQDTKRLFFTSIGEVKLKFTYAGVTKHVIFTTDKISETVKFSDETIVVSKDEYFSFSDVVDVSKLSDLKLSDGAVLESSEVNFLVKTSGDFTLTGMLDGIPFKKTLRVTSEFKGISGVKIEDEGITSSPTAISENGTYLTASQTVKVTFDGIGDAFKADGTKPTVTYSLIGDFATIDEAAGVITFTTHGTVMFKIKVDDVEFTANVQSTCGLFNTTTEFYTVTSEFYVESNNTLSLNTLYKTVSPANANRTNAWFVIGSYGDKVTLASDKQSVTFNRGGDYELKIVYKTIDGEKETTLNVHANEEPESLTATNTFVIATDKVFEVSSLFSIYPSTANYKTKATYSFESSCASISDGKLTFTSAGKAVVTVTLEKEGITKTFAVVYYGETAKLNGGFVEKGSNFAIDLESVASSLSATTEITISNDYATISNGFVITVNKVGKFQVTIGDNTYYFEGVVKATGVNIGIADNAEESKAHLLSNGTYLTGLKDEAITIYATLNEGATNKGITYAITSGGDCATIEETTGKLTFSAAGIVTVTATEKFGKSASITIRSTYGKVESVTLKSGSKLTLDYDDDQLATGYDFTDYFTPYPAQASITTNTVTFSVSGKDNESATVTKADFIIKLSARTNFTLTCTPIGSTSEKDVASVKIIVKRKATSIDFLDENGNGGITQVVTLKKVFSLSTKILPVDSTDAVASYEIISGNAKVENGIVEFLSEEAQTAVVKVTASGGATSELSITYIPDTANPVQVTNGGSYSFDMPKSTAEKQFVPFAPYSLPYSSNEIEYYVNDVKVEGLSANIGAPGTYTIAARDKAGTTLAESTVTVIRKAESVSADLYAKWGETKEPLSGTLYTSAKTISIENIAITPADATKTKPDSIVSSDTTVATVSGNVLTFGKAGTVTLTIKVDEATFTATIESTCGLFDDKTVVNTDAHAIDKGTSLDIREIITTVSPKNADVTNAWFIYNGEKKGQSITFDKGGEYNVQVAYTDKNNGTVTSASIKITLREEPESLTATKGEFVITASNEVTLSSLFSIEPSTANYLIGATYSLESSCASISDGKLTFTSAGKAVVTVKLEKEGVTKTFAVVYYGETTKLNGGFIEKGSSFAIDLESVASSLSADSAISINNDYATISNGLIITVDKVGEFQVTIGSTTYDFEGVVKATGVSINIANSNDAHSVEGGYLTGLKEIALTSSVKGANVTYTDVTYTLNEGAKATIDQSTGVLTFNEAGTVTVTATEKFGKSASITIRSTYGKVESVSLKDNNNTTLTLDYDEAGFGESGYDFTNYFTPYPAQASIAADTVALSVIGISANYEINGLKVKLAARTNFTLTCTSKSASSSASITVTVNRKATSVKVNGTDISEITKITADRSFIDVKTALVPADANQLTTISFAITVGDEYATLSGNRITFNQADKDVTVTFTYANGATKAVIFSTSRLTETVSFSSGTIVVQRGKLFTFGDVDFDSITDLALTDGVAITTDGNNYKVGTSGSYTLSGKNNGAAFTKTLIVTAPFAGFNGVKVTDSKDGTADDTSIEANAEYSTASKVLTVSFDGVGDAVNRDGSKPTVTYGLNTTSVASITQDGVLTFSGSGTVTVVITVSGTNHNGAKYTETFTFTVYSSFGHIDEFTLKDENATIDITIDDTSSYELTYGDYEPLNGTVSEKLSFASNNEEIATVDENGLVKFFGTGDLTITVSAVKGNGTTVSKTINFEIDKRVDKITVVHSTTDDRQRSEVKTNQETYNLATALSSTESGTPTAPKSLKRSSANTSGERVLDLSKIAPTLTTLTYSVKGNKTGCSVDQNGVVTFTASGKYVIVITAVGGATIEFPITKVDSGVEIIEVDTSKEISSINFTAGKQYVIDAGFGSTVPTVDIPFTDVIVSVNAELGVFKTEKGGTGSQITITAEITATITTFVEQEVTDITFTKPISDISNTADATFDLTAYGAKVVPASAGRVVNGAFTPYEVTYASSNDDVASVENGLLTFHKAGEVTVTFTAGDITKSFTVNSTYGFATKIELAQTFKQLEYTNGSYTFVKGTDFIVTPANAWESKYNLTITSSNKNVATVNGLTLNFVGGGETTLTFNYTVLSPSGTSATATQTLTVRVIKRASGVSVTYDGRTTQNVLTSGDFKLIASVLGDNLSPSKLVYSSASEDVATVDTNGNVTFYKSGVACKITVGVVSDYDGSTEATTEITVRKAPYTIKQITDTTSALEFNYENGTNYSLYYIGSALPSTFTATSDGVLTVTEQGDIAIAKGGTATLTITTGSATKTVEIAVYRRATDFETSSKLTNEEYVIAGTTLNLFDKAPLETITPAGAAYGKTVEFDYDESIATIDENGTVTFKTNATLTVDVLVKRGDTVEVGKTVTVRSTLGKAITAQIKKDGAAAGNSYTLDVGKSITFTVDGLLPSDLTLTAQTLTATPSVGGVVTAQVNAENKTITVNGVGKGSCTLTINVAGFNYTVSLTVIQKATEVRIKYNGNVVSTINTLNDTLTLTAEVLPVTANDTAVIWSASSGVSVNNGVVTLPAAYGTYTVTATAHDGSGCYATVTIEYKDLTGFSLAFDGKTVENNGTVYMAHNEGSITVTIVPEPSTITGVNVNDFAATSPQGSSISFDQASFTMTITTPSMNDHFEDIITVTYKGKYEYKLNVYRSGVQAITFKYVNKDLDNKLDTGYGYQQMLIFGNRSYYGGIQSYYKMAVEVKPSNDYLQYVNFTANKGLTITKDNNDNSFVYVNFNGFAGSSLAEILADNFTNGEAVVSATDIGKKLGDVAYSYTYHVVNAVNIFDAAGYIGGGSDIVLHVNLGHDDEISSGLPNCVKFEGYENSLNKTTIYGNGYLINYAYENNRHTDRKLVELKFQTVIVASNENGYTPISITNSINVKLKGTNDIVLENKERDYYFVELSGVQNVYYCEAYNMYRVIESYNSTPYIKRSLFRTCAESGAISSAQGSAANGTSAMTFEDVIMFDVGSRAIETHANPIRVKGFLDVYNFQNKSALKKALPAGELIGGGVFDKITSENASLIEEVNGEKWFNMVGLSAKDKDKKMYYYTEGYTENSGYKLITTSEPAANGLKKIEITYGLNKFSIWSYPNTNDYIRWSDQFNADGSLNHSKMISTTWKVTRLRQQPTSSN